jgi:hypothetical protein
MPGVEGFSLSDNNCSNTHLTVDIPVEVRGGSQLRDAYQKGDLGTSDKVITATWVGKFNRQTKTFPRPFFSVVEIKDVSLAWK